MRKEFDAALRGHILSACTFRPRDRSRARIDLAVVRCRAKPQLAFAHSRPEISLSSWLRNASRAGDRREMRPTLLGRVRRQMSTLTLKEAL